ncbi:MAG: hypothetical protein ACAH83_08540 [Alphaproteobacteria bacterium]
MTARILFRFHHNEQVCCQNLHILRLLNPDVAIDGMYGGPGAPPQAVVDLLDNCWTIPLEDPHYKWKNGDLCVRWWFKQEGHKHSFSHLSLIEWDLLLLKSLAGIFGTFDANTNYASLFGDTAEAKRINWYWIREQFGYEIGRTLHHLNESGKPVDFDKLEFGIMGGCVFSRKFLEMFAAGEIRSHSNDEARFSVYSAAYGIPLKDNGLLRDPRNRFNADNQEYGESDLDAVISAGGKVIHPLRIVIPDLAEKILKYQTPS